MMILKSKVVLLWMRGIFMYSILNLRSKVKIRYIMDIYELNKEYIYQA